MFARHNLDEFTIDNAVDGDDNSEEVGKAEYTSGPNFRRVIGNINLK